MPERRAKSDDTLEIYRAEWRESRKKLTLKKALDYCRTRHEPEPPWLHNALYRLGRELVTRLKKTGRPTDLRSDDALYATVEDYREKGVTLDKALQLTAREYFGGGELHGRALTVKSAWLRHRNRIEKIEPTEPNACLGWRIKEKYRCGHDKSAALLGELPIPPYLRTKNK